MSNKRTEIWKDLGISQPEHIFGKSTQNHVPVQQAKITEPLPQKNVVHAEKNRKYQSRTDQLSL